MTVLKYLVPALAVASSVSAQCSTKATLTVTNTLDASKLASCQTYTGSIAIATHAAGDIALDGPKVIEGNLVVTNVKGLTSLSASNLQTIKGTWSLTSVNSLSSLSFPMLSEVFTIDWSAIGNVLTSLDFTTGVSKVKNLMIVSTYLFSLQGINPTTAETVEIASNYAIQNLSLAFTNVTKSLSVQGNQQGLTLSLPKLKAATFLQISNCSSISLPKLTDSISGVAFTGNAVKSLSFPKLKDTGSFAVNDNTFLKSLSVPKLTKVDGAFSVQNNTKLTGTLSFPKVESIRGGPFIIGTFTGLKMPSLQSVIGHMYISSTKNIQSAVCNHFDSLPSSVLQGKVYCKSKAGSAAKKSKKGEHTSTGGKSPGGGGTGPKTHHNTAAQQQTSLGAVFTIFGAVATFFAVLL